jgi:hypothetical protein
MHWSIGPTKCEGDWPSLEDVELLERKPFWNVENCIEEYVKKKKGD